MLESNDIVNLYRGIEFDTEYESISDSSSKPRITEPEEDIPVLSGEWIVEEVWESGDAGNKVGRPARFFLQQEGRTLRGYAETSYMWNDPDPEYLVAQEISGYIRDSKIELVATSYQLLKAPQTATDQGWNLDTWRGELENADSFSGEVFDNRRTGTFVAKKVRSEGG